MYEGKIIKYYREKKQLTQEQLGKGICSTTHISKIERLQTEYAPEIITLLSKKLEINIHEEIQNLFNIKKRLSDWHDAIIMQLFDEMDRINNELENEDLIQISDYMYLYKLLRARYLLMHRKTKEALIIINEIQKIEHKLTSYESNLLKHVLGMYYLEQKDFLKAIQILKEIQIEIYNNPEYYYHLSMAYHTIESPALAYFYAEKSRQFFKEINSYLRVIDAEMIMTIQVKDVYDNEIIKRFESLIHSCDLCNAPERKAKVKHNLAYELFRRGNYEQASKFYKESMSLKEKGSDTYLISLEGYIHSSFDGNLLSKAELLQLAEEGLETAIKDNQLLYKHLFTLHSLLIQSKEQEYHQYLQEEALPMYNKFGFSFLIQRSKKELFNFYNKTRQVDKALEVARELIIQ
ncbi:helix-turn-helix domain-containing protein [Bacillus sp. RG28]|uniref:Helix-turn-helix domain-containing protein n=1 Tax=Gottfriedia endophytica TaxID=2820819 RepID=A0A940NSR5_9BACI|nr:helix-turn-helix transcriptional regulator [Gottfriedia endophytica]MBP0726116.1 helix-turn-helix domain-containing protein [Gottfriedia endophytica]